MNVVKMRRSNERKLEAAHPLRYWLQVPTTTVVRDGEMMSIFDWNHTATVTSR